MTNLTKLSTVNLNYITIGTLKLPSSVNDLSIKNTREFPDLSKLSNLKSLNYSIDDNWGPWTSTNIISSLKSKILNENVATEISLYGLDELNDLSDICTRFKASTLGISNCINLTSLNGVDSMIGLTELVLINDTSLLDIAGVSSLSNLKSFTMNNCAVSNLSELTNLTSLNYIDLKNNSFEGNTNIEILSKLREKNKNLKLYLFGCKNILDWSLLSKYTGWWHDDEKAGYPNS